MTKSEAAIKAGGHRARGHWHESTEAVELENFRWEIPLAVRDLAKCAYLNGSQKGKFKGNILSLVILVYMESVPVGRGKPK